MHSVIFLNKAFMYVCIDSVDSSTVNYSHWQYDIAFTSSIIRIRISSVLELDKTSISISTDSYSWCSRPHVLESTLSGRWSPEVRLLLQSRPKVRWL